MSGNFDRTRSRIVRFLATRGRAQTNHSSTLHEKENQFYRSARRPLPNQRSVQMPEYPGQATISPWPDRHALGLLILKKNGSTMTMLSARGVKVETIDEVIANGLATASVERVGRGAIEITRVKITEAGRRALEDPAFRAGGPTAPTGRSGGDELGWQHPAVA